MEFWNNILTFFTENVALLAVLAGLTVIATILEKTTKIFQPIKDIFGRRKDAKQKKRLMETDLYNTMKELNDKVSKLSESFETDITQVKNDLQNYITEDTQCRKEIIESIKNLEKGNAYSLGEMIRRIYLEHEKAQTIPERDYKIISKAYEIYHDKLGGNGPVQKMMETIDSEWTIEYH